MPGTPTVTVVVPVRDDAVALRACLAHLAAQSVAPDEILVVDNGSTDASAAVARSAGARVLTEPRPGILPAVCTGFDAARGELLLRCDADSRPPRRWVEALAGRLGADPDLDAVTGPGTFVTLPRWLRGAAWAFYAAGYFGAMGAAGAGLPLWGSNMALRATAWRSISDRVHRDRADLHDDLEISLALGPTARVGWVGGVRMPVEARFTAPGRLRRQVRMGLATLAVNGGRRGPGQRWTQRWTTWRAGRRAAP